MSKLFLKNDVFLEYIFKKISLLKNNKFSK